MRVRLWFIGYAVGTFGWSTHYYRSGTFGWSTLYSRCGTFG